MEKADFIYITRSFLKENKDLRLYLTGTGNLMLQGVEVKPNDIDFITDKETLTGLANKYDAQVRKNEDGYFEFDTEYRNAEIHVVSNKENKLRPNNLEKNSVVIQKDSVDILGMSLESERKAYLMMNREKDINKVKLIDRVLKE